VREELIEFAGLVAAESDGVPEAAAEVSTDQSFTVPSSLQVAKLAPFGLNATLKTLLYVRHRHLAVGPRVWQQAAAIDG
jgi:hypothetical protein